MPDPKRERKRQNRDAARAAQLEAARAAKKKQSAIRAGVGLVLVLGLAALGALVLGGDDDKTDVSSESSTSTTGASTSTTENPALAAVQCNDTTPPAKTDRPTFTEPPAMSIDPAKKYTAVMDTSCGEITIELDAKNAPKTVNNFVFLARKDFYDGLTWHRVVSDFVIQGGDPEGTGSGGPGYKFEDELPQDGYKLGSLAMANSGPGTNGSQFFIVTGENGTTLPNNYSRFGMVTGGLEVAQKMESFAQPDQKPSRPLYIFDIEIKEG
jgi:cyclophilin family peptidyl-prolyl cis-trans isomerase